MKTTLTSLPRNLPPKIAAATLAATLRGARHRRVRRRFQRAAAAMLVFLVATAWWSRHEQVHDTEMVRIPPPALETTPLPAAPAPAVHRKTDIAEAAVTQDPLAEQTKNSFVLIHSRPLPVAPPISTETRDLPVPSCTVVRTASVPSPLIVTTARAAAALTVATGDQPEALVTASDDDLFLLADGRPAALCRFPSGDTRWIWLTP